MEGSELEGHHTRDPLQRAEPLLVAGGTVWGEQDVAHVPIPSHHLGGAVGEGLAKGGPRFQALALGFAKAGGCADADTLDAPAGLHRQTVADRLDGHLLHGGLAGPDGRDGVNLTAEMDPAYEVRPVDGDELLEGRGVLVVVGGRKVLQGDLELLTQRRARVKAEAGGKQSSDQGL